MPLELCRTHFPHVAVPISKQSPLSGEVMFAGFHPRSAISRQRKKLHDVETWVFTNRRVDSDRLLSNVGDGKDKGRACIKKRPVAYTSSSISRIPISHIHTTTSTTTTSQKLLKMAATTDFQGWVAHDASAAEGNMKWGGYTPKTFEETDVELDIEMCGVCGSDIHTLRSGWGPSDYPLVVGHEIIGKVTRVGNSVTDLKVGDRVGVGAQSECCEACKPCKMTQESNCEKMTMTYNGKHSNGDKSFGGYAKVWRGPASFAVPIPEGLRSEFAAPLMCGGVTVYNPLVTYGAGPGKRVGVVGVGGLGHFALLFAKALGCDEVVALSRSSSKKDDALALGADRFIATGEDPDWASNNANSLDLIISTVSGSFPLDQYLQLLSVNGTFVQLGAPDDPLPSFSPLGLIFKNLKIAGSLIGTRAQIREMLELAKSTDLQAWVQVRPMEEANEVLKDFEKGLPKYRYVLSNVQQEAESP